MGGFFKHAQTSDFRRQFFQDKLKFVQKSSNNIISQLKLQSISMEYIAGKYALMQMPHAIAHANAIGSPPATRMPDIVVLWENGDEVDGDTIDFFGFASAEVVPFSLAPAFVMLGEGAERFAADAVQMPVGV